MDPLSSSMDSQLQQPGMPGIQQYDLHRRLKEISREQWLDLLRREWFQGEHIVVMGPTGSGKTRIVNEIADLREYVAVLIIKRKDDSLDLYWDKKYKFINSWPPEYSFKKVVLHLKPNSMQDIMKQRGKMQRALTEIYLSGGRCLVVDEAGYMTGVLGLRQELVILLNQGRSSHLSIICGMTRPSSVIQQIPREAFSQVRHVLIFRYKDEKDSKAAGAIAGISARNVVDYMQELRFNTPQHIGDFLYIGKGTEVYVVRTH
jgi:energy-coupling factor transporter ATP-binding protein EcfA2